MNVTSKKTPIFVIGYMGTDRAGLGRVLAEKYSRPLLFLDEEIEKRDGRTILTLCMTMGEHEYRNKEYELLQEILKAEDLDPPVVVCGDGILLDDMNHKALLELYTQNAEAVVLAEDSISAMWQRARGDKTIPYAFMHMGGPEGSPAEEARYRKFCELYEQRLKLYNPFKFTTCIFS